MGIAYSPPDKVVHADIDPSTSHCLRQGLHRAVTLAGWEVDREIDKGYVYILTSPQDASLQCKVQIQDSGLIVYAYSGASCVDIRFLSLDETVITQQFPIKYSAGVTGQPAPRRLRVHVTPCQFFSYYPGQAGRVDCVMGGIPFVDPNALSSTVERCADEDNELKTWRAFWACGDICMGNLVYGVNTFRTSWVATEYATLHNDTYVTESRYWIRDESLLRMVPLGKADHFWAAYGNANSDYPLILRWMGTEEPLCFDPFIAWAGTHPVKIRGQLWDAFWRTKYVPWESPLTFDDLSWFSYSTGDSQAPHIYSTGDLFTLYLRDPGLTVINCDEPEPEAPAESNYAY